MFLIYVSGSVEENHEFLNLVNRTCPKSITTPAICADQYSGMHLKFENKFVGDTSQNRFEFTSEILVTERCPGLLEKIDHRSGRLLRSGVQCEKKVSQVFKGQRTVDGHRGKREGYGILVECDYDDNPPGGDVFLPFFCPLEFRTRMYEGQWQEDKEHGHGKWCTPGYLPEADGPYEYLHGVTYSDRKKTKWVLSSQTDMRYEGQWHTGKFHGRGTLTNRAIIPQSPTVRRQQSAVGEDKYVGQFKEGVFHGQGMLMYNWIHNPENQRHPAIEPWHDPVPKKYIGQWECGEYHGHGELTFINGSRYVGQFKQGRYNGEGKHTSNAGTERACDKIVHRGQYVDGKRHGYGTYSTPANVFRGQFSNDQFQHGEMTLKESNTIIILIRVVFCIF